MPEEVIDLKTGVWRWIFIGCIIWLCLAPPVYAGYAGETSYDDGNAAAAGEVVPPLTVISNREELARFINENQLNGLSVTESRTEITGCRPNGELVKLPLVLNQETLLGLQEHRIYSYPARNFPWTWVILLALVLVGATALIVHHLARREQRQEPGTPAGASGYQFSTYSHKKELKNNTLITFSQVAGLEEAKEELQEILLFLTDAEKFHRLGAKMPRGVILYGPPGTGKTLLARALAGEAQASFFPVSGSEFLEKYVGVGASRIRGLFENARRSPPSIIFIDEIDAVGRKRSDDDRSNEEKDRTLNQLLVEMDGFNCSSTVVVIGATNRLDMLDKALLRPGRFDRHIAIDTPTMKERLEILRLHTRNKPLSGVNLETVAQRTPGLTGADLANLCNEAAIIAARGGKSLIESQELERAMDRITAGMERKAHVLSEQEKRTIAFHEGGHALVTSLLGHETVSRVSILPRGKALGFVLQTPDSDRFILSRQDLIQQILSLLGGRAAEETVIGQVSTGAKNDLERATDIATRMVTELGMGGLGLSNCSHLLGSYQVPLAVHQAVEEIVDDCYRQALSLVRANQDKLTRLAETLMVRETLTGKEIGELLGTCSG
ncbi:MAG: ATP-dependent zinc metalloprotease FtsH [Firmicutes bacterium]|nr:ATP-dependent zinc metalloprotease FtsH [Bacillota bacterium]